MRYKSALVHYVLCVQKGVMSTGPSVASTLEPLIDQFIMVVTCEGKIFVGQLVRQDFG